MMERIPYHLRAHIMEFSMESNRPRRDVELSKIELKDNDREESLTEMKTRLMIEEDRKNLLVQCFHRDGLLMALLHKIRRDLVSFYQQPIEEPLMIYREINYRKFLKGEEKNIHIIAEGEEVIILFPMNRHQLWAVHYHVFPLQENILQFIVDSPILPYQINRVF